jgi:hypothetical protein
MEDRTTHTWAVGFFGFAVAFGVISLAVHTWRAWVAVGLAALFLVLAGLFGVIAYRNRPRLFIGDSLIDKTIFTSPVGEAWHSTDIVDVTETFLPVPSGQTATTSPTIISGTIQRTRPIVYLHVWNEPRREKSTRYADKVHLKIKFFGDADEPTEIVARWSDLDQRDAPETFSIPRPRDIPPNGNKYRIDVAALFDDGFYAMNDRARIGGFKVFPLGNGPIKVEVAARGTGGLKAIGNWRLESKDGTVTLTEVSS